MGSKYTPLVVRDLNKVQPLKRFFVYVSGTDNISTAYTAYTSATSSDKCVKENFTYNISGQLIKSNLEEDFWNTDYDI